MTTSVAHVLRTYGVSGGERQLAQLFAAEAGSVYENTFYSLYDNPSCAEYFARINGLKLRTVLGFRASAFPSLATELALLALLAPILQLRMLIMIGSRDHRICVVHGLQAAVACWLAACLLRHVRFVYIHRGTKSRAGSHPIFKILYWPYEIIAGVSIASAESLRPLAGKRKVVALENGIDLEQLREIAKGCGERRSDDSLRLISSARLIKDKEHAFLLDVFVQLLQRWPNLEFVIAGEGPERRNLMECAQQRGVASKVHLIGHVKDIVCRMVDSDIFVHASRMEGMSNSVLEAMALGLPSVVVDAPGVSECHRDSETGFVVPRDTDLMAAKLAMLISDRDLRSIMGEKARQRAQNKYSIAANRDRYHSLYRELLES
ncbi:MULTISPECIES: glycosyltransferase family 4 protein [Bradyrhizobium]|uniref:glycosyltransferase family 4 protein n=1 Tax=Bradyrhizobium TaxID=374 RepID=UPI000C1F71A0|nr:MULTISPECIES: glycosyltransferase family 4 protein [Bradyrhizobium]